MIAIISTKELERLRAAERELDDMKHDLIRVHHIAAHLRHDSRKLKLSLV